MCLPIDLSKISILLSMSASYFDHYIGFSSNLRPFVVADMAESGPFQPGIFCLYNMSAVLTICPNRPLTKMCRLRSKPLSKIITAVVAVRSSSCALYPTTQHPLHIIPLPGGLQIHQQLVRDK